MVIPFWVIYILVTFIVAAAICTIGYFVDTAIETRKIKMQDYSPYQRGDIVLYAGNQEFIFNGERFESLACVHDEQTKEDIPKHTNCVNCGATLSGKHRCRYCGTYNH